VDICVKELVSEGALLFEFKIQRRRLLWRGEVHRLCRLFEVTAVLHWGLRGSLIEITICDALAEIASRFLAAPGGRHFLFQGLLLSQWVLM